MKILQFYYFYIMNMCSNQYTDHISLVGYILNDKDLQINLKAYLGR